MFSRGFKDGRPHEERGGFEICFEPQVAFTALFAPGHQVEFHLGPRERPECIDADRGTQRNEKQSGDACCHSERTSPWPPEKKADTGENIFGAHNPGDGEHEPTVFHEQEGAAEYKSDKIDCEEKSTEHLSMLFRSRHLNESIRTVF